MASGDREIDDDDDDDDDVDDERNDTEKVESTCTVAGACEIKIPKSQLIK